MGPVIETRLARDDERAALMALRTSVFVREQGVPADLERDDRDAAAVHLVAVDEGRVIATCRLVPGPRAWRLGRMAVRRDRRGAGIGRRLLALAHEVAFGRGAQALVLHAQISARDFYAAAGYAAEGEEFAEAGIDHIQMRWRPPGA